MSLAQEKSFDYEKQEQKIKLPITVRDTMLPKQLKLRVVEQAILDLNKDGLKDWAFIAGGAVGDGSEHNNEVDRDYDFSETIVGIYFKKTEGGYSLAVQANDFFAETDAGGNKVSLFGTDNGCLDFIGSPQGSGHYETTERYRWQNGGFMLIGVNGYASDWDYLYYDEWNLNTGKWTESKIKKTNEKEAKKEVARHGIDKRKTLPKLQDIHFGETQHR